MAVTAWSPGIKPRPTMAWFLHKQVRSVENAIAGHAPDERGRDKVFIVAEDPGALLAVLSKQWRGLIWQVQRERSNTLNAKRICALTQKAINMQRVRFTLKSTTDEPTANVFFMSVAALAAQPPHCGTLYLTCPVNTAIQDRLTSHMLQHGLVVVRV